VTGELIGLGEDTRRGCEGRMEAAWGLKGLVRIVVWVLTPFFQRRARSVN